MKYYDYSMIFFPETYIKFVNYIVNNNLKVNMIFIIICICMKLLKIKKLNKYKIEELVWLLKKNMSYHNNELWNFIKIKNLNIKDEIHLISFLNVVGELKNKQKIKVKTLPKKWTRVILKTLIYLIIKENSKLIYPPNSKTMNDKIEWFFLYHSTNWFPIQLNTLKCIQNKIGKTYFSDKYINNLLKNWITKNIRNHSFKELSDNKQDSIYIKIWNLYFLNPRFTNYLLWEILEKEKIKSWEEHKFLNKLTLNDFKSIKIYIKDWFEKDSDIDYILEDSIWNIIIFEIKNVKDLSLYLNQKQNIQKLLIDDDLKTKNKPLWKGLSQLSNIYNNKNIKSFLQNNQSLILKQPIKNIYYCLFSFQNSALFNYFIKRHLLFNSYTQYGITDDRNFYENLSFIDIGEFLNLIILQETQITINQTINFENIFRQINNLSYKSNNKDFIYEDWPKYIRNSDTIKVEYSITWYDSFSSILSKIQKEIENIIRI